MAETLVQTQPERVDKVRVYPPKFLERKYHPELHADLANREHIFLFSPAQYSRADPIIHASASFRSCKALVLYDGNLGSLAHMWYDDDPAPYIKSMKRDLKSPRIQAIAVAGPDEIYGIEQALLDENVTVKSLIRLLDKPDKDILFTPLDKQVKIYRRGETPVIALFD